MYEDKIIRFRDKSKKMKGIVVVCEDGIGLTVIDNFGNYALCITLPQSPKWEKDLWKGKEESVTQVYNIIKEQIKNGYISIDEATLEKTNYGEIERNISEDSCPFRA